MPEVLPHTDQEVLNLLKTRSEKAFLDVYKQHKNGLVQWIRNRFGFESEDCIEIYQLTMVTFYENVINDKINALTSSLKTYLFAIARNKALEFSRKRNIMVPLEVADQDVMAVTEVPLREEELADAENRLTAMKTSMQKLGSPCAEILTLFYFQKESLHNIKDRFGYKNEETVKSQKFKCMERLRKIYFNHYQQPL